MEITEFIATWQTPIRITVIVIAAILLRISIKIASNRLVKTIAKTSESKGVLAEQRVLARTATMASILDNLATWGIAITATVMILSELGVNTGALIAVTTILGAAIGFGGQALVKDVISGIFIVFEDQYGVGDKVNLDGVEGEVERVGLRVTQVRDRTGALWYVRNGEILKVGNSTQK